MIAIASLAGPVPCANAQSGGGCTITKSTIDSGGGTVAGGIYILCATIGQPDATFLSGGGYFLTGGFWSPKATAAAPAALSLEPDGVRMNRFVGVVVPSESAGQQTALRVTLTTLNHPRLCCTNGAGASCSDSPCDVDAHCSAVPGGNQTCAHQVMAGLPDYSAMQDNIRYVNSFTFPAVGGSLDCPDGGPPFETSYRQIPGLIYITGDAVLTSSTLAISHIAASCGAAATANACATASAPLAVGTARWGDLNGAGFTAPDGKADVLDIPPIVNKLKTVSPIFPEPRLWLKQRDPVPNTDAITVIDLSDVVDGGPQAKPYPASRTIDSCPHD